jgi:hypothetical protein
MVKNMKTIQQLFIALFFLLPGMQANAQFTVTAIPPPSSTFTFDELWHLNVTGPATSNYVEFYIALRIFNNADGNLMVKSNSAIFPFSQIPLHATPANLGSLNALSTLYYDNNLQNIVQNGGFFPVGVYDIQFVLLGRPTDGEFTELAEYDYQKIVEAFWPPMLLYPYNEDTIDNPYPILTWTPAFYASPGTTIEYSLWLVKLNGNQDPYQGITSNPYILQSTHLNSTTLPYPPSVYNMQVGDRFGWQVAATINNQPIAYTEVWSFVYYVDTILDTVPEIEKIYFNVKRINDISGGLDALVSVEDYIRFQFDHEYFIPDTSRIHFVIKDKDDATVFNSSQSNVYPISFGMNRYVLDPCQLNLQHDAPYYKLIAYNAKHEAFYMYFKISQTVTCPH